MRVDLVDRQLFSKVRAMAQDRKVLWTTEQRPGGGGSFSAWFKALGHFFILVHGLHDMLVDPCRSLQLWYFKGKHHRSLTVSPTALPFGRSGGETKQIHFFLKGLCRVVMTNMSETFSYFLHLFAMSCPFSGWFVQVCDPQGSFTAQ